MSPKCHWCSNWSIHSWKCVEYCRCCRPFSKQNMKAFSRERKEVAAKVVEHLNLDRWKFSWFTNILKQKCGIESVLKRQRKVTNPRWLKCPYRIMLGIHLGSRGGFPEKTPLAFRNRNNRHITKIWLPHWDFMDFWVCVQEPFANVFSSIVTCDIYETSMLTFQRQAPIFFLTLFGPEICTAGPQCKTMNFLPTNQHTNCSVHDIYRRRVDKKTYAHKRL